MAKLSPTFPVRQNLKIYTNCDDLRSLVVITVFVVTFLLASRKIKKGFSLFVNPPTTHDLNTDC